MKHIHGGNVYRMEGVLDFSANINPLGMPEGVRIAIASCADACLHYPDPDCRSLTEAIAGAEGIASDHIICGNGAAELIYLLAGAKKGQRALLTIPAFAEYEEALIAAGCELSFYPCPKDSGYAVEEDYLEALKDDPDLVFLCNPNNPTGRLIDPKLLIKIHELCLEKGILLVLDECFLDFCDEKESRTLVGRLSLGNLFILKAFTKMYAMPGIRLGYGMTTEEKLLSDMKALRQPWSVSVPAQLAGIAALGEKEFVPETVAFVKEERAFLLEELSKRGFSVLEGAANFLFFTSEIPKLSEKLADEKILIRSCANYRGLTENCYRIAVRRREENLRLLAAIDAVIQ